MKRAVAIFVLLLGVVAGCGSKSNKPGSCKSDKDCQKNKTGQVCDNNKCVECKTDAQCPKGKKCSANACVAPTGCKADSECPNGQVCQAGKCKPCAVDADCPGGVCQAGQCTKAKPCKKDEECADDEDCVNGFCKKAGQSTGGDATCSLSTIYFAFDDSSIQPSERDRLDANEKCIAQNKAKSVYLVGHTDTQGTEEYNIALSERRARSVADYLSRLGADPARLQVVPKGETESTGLGDDKDRRCEFQWK